MRGMPVVVMGMLGLMAVAAQKPAATAAPAPVSIAVPAVPNGCRLPPIASLSGPEDRIELLLATTPDPRVQRHRRFYDHTITAISSGMLEGGFVLDRFGLPWQEGLRAGTPAPAADDGCYGWMLFRQDSWRDLAGSDAAVIAATDGARGVALRLLLLVPETASYGVGQKALDAAVDTVADLIANGRGRRMLASYPGCTAGGDGVKPLLVLGPAFSGSLESLLRASARTGYGGRPPGLCAVTASATASSNAAADQLPGSRPPRFRIISLAVTDSQRMLTLAKLAGIGKPDGDSGADGEQVAFLTEATVFGKDICPDPGTKQYDALTPEYQALCKQSLQLSFPANIADLRLDADAEAAQQRKMSPLKLPANSRTLSLDGIGETGSEFPDSVQSPATSVSTELQLDAALDRLATSRARIVVVVATDVRDRLFLFQKVRERLPEALLIDFNADRLLAHPDSSAASRGALVLASSELLCAQSDERYCWNVGETVNQLRFRRQNLRLSAWPTDHHAILAKSVSRIGRDSPGRCPTLDDPEGACESRAPLVQVVGYDGLHSLASRGGERHLGLRLIPGLLIGLVALFVSALWLWRYNATMRAITAKALRGVEPPPAPSAGDPGLTWRDHVALLVLPVLAFFLFFEALDYAIYAGVIVVALLLSLQIQRLVKSSRKTRYTLTSDSARRRDGGHRGHWGGVLWIVFVVLLMLALLAGELLWWCRSAGIAAQLTLDPRALRALILDSGSGLAWFIALVMAQVTLAVVCALLLTGLSANARNARLLPNEPFLSLLYERFLDWKDPLIVLVAIPSLAVALIVGLGGLRRTIFGDIASALVLAAITATTISAMVLVAVQFNIVRRVLRLSAYVRHRLQLNAPAGRATDAPIPGLWKPDDPYFPMSFAATPVIASIRYAHERSDDYAGIDRLDAWRQQISEDLGSAPDALRSRLPLFLLFASELTLLRGAAIGAAMAAVAGVLIVYLFPVTAAGSFVGINVCVLACAGLLSGYAAVQFERDELLSNVLCNRSKETRFSTQLFAYIAFPFVLLAAAIAITEIPGMLDWGGGFIGWALNKLGAGL